jgi:hypothetical protein
MSRGDKRELVSMSVFQSFSKAGEEFTGSGCGFWLKGMLAQGQRFTELLKY